MLLRLALVIVLAASCAPVAAADAFGLVLHVNGGADPTLYRGEPLLVQTLLILEQDEAATVALAGGQPWTRALSLTLLDGAGQAVPLEWATLGGAPAASLAFTQEATEIPAVMGLAPAVVDARPPGDYRLEAVFSTEESAAPGAWKGEVRAPRVVLKLRAEQPPELPARAGLQAPAPGPLAAAERPPRCCAYGVGRRFGAGAGRHSGAVRQG